MNASGTGSSETVYSELRVLRETWAEEKGGQLRPPFNYRLILVDLFNDATLGRLHEVGAMLPVDVPIIPDRRGFAIDRLRELFNLDSIRHTFALRISTRAAAALPVVRRSVVTRVCLRTTSRSLSVNVTFLLELAGAAAVVPPERGNTVTIL
jgi:hypothetical protein